MKDIDISCRRDSHGVISIKRGYDAFLQAFMDVIETRCGENIEDVERGTHIHDYLNESVNVFNAMMIEDEIRYTLINYFDNYEVDENSIEVKSDYDNNEYVVSLNIKERNLKEAERDLTFSIEVMR